MRNRIQEASVPNRKPENRQTSAVNLVLLGVVQGRAAEVEGENRSGPALNPLKGSSDRSPHLLLIGHAARQT